jgi:hypothetical protein
MDAPAIGQDLRKIGLDCKRGAQKRLRLFEVVQLDTGESLAGHRLQVTRLQ